MYASKQFRLFCGSAFALLSVVCCNQAKAQTPATSGGKTYVVSPSDDVQYRLQELIINALPGDTIQLEAGRYEFQNQIDVAVDNITIRGSGSDKTILSFKKQASGGQGIEATGNNFLIEGLAVEDTAGNAIKVVGARNVTFRDVRAEWTGPASMTNGAYGIYPVQCQNVLMEKCSAYGASDAGLYVGQCHDVVVRQCRAERNVAGIEIENTIGADVYHNVATNNTGGILVFDLPGLQIKTGHTVRVYENQIYDNNHENFADPGGIVSTVSPGTGVIVLATDHVEVFQNKIENNQTVGVCIVSFLTVGRKVNDTEYDPTSHRISIHDNLITNCGKKPTGEMGKVLKPVLGVEFPDILWDGIVKKDAVGPPLSIANNGQATFANYRFEDLSPENLLKGKYKLDRDIAKLAVEIPKLSAVSLKPHDPPHSGLTEAVKVYRSLPKLLSEFKLFEGELKLQKPAKDVLFYELNAELFSDYAAKDRFIKLPTGSQLQYRETGVIDFPVGTVIAKTFSYLHDARKTDGGSRILETRIELLTETGWYGASYIWNAHQTDAELSLGGNDTQVQWIDQQGKQQQIRYQIPNANQCITCHSHDKKFVPIGTTAQNLNRSSSHSGQDQLSHWAERGLLVGLPASHGDIAHWPRLSQENSGTVETRARAWLDVNCAHCHSPGGSARTTGLDLRWLQQDLAKVGLWKTPVAAGPGSGGRKFGIVPGKPDQSILMHRLESDDPKAMMPNVGRSMVHDQGIALVRSWIESLPVEKQ
jgi:parallel beta-helix repeat protein